jgi:hypothetical protein
MMVSAKNTVKAAKASRTSERQARLGVDECKSEKPQTTNAQWLGSYEVGYRPQQEPWHHLHAMNDRPHFRRNVDGTD